MKKLPSEKTIRRRDPVKTIEVLFKISEAVSNTRNLDELYGVIHKNLGKILNVDNFYIALHNEEKDKVTFPYHVDQKTDMPSEIKDFSLRPSSVRKVIEQKNPIIFYDDDIIQLANKKKEYQEAISKIWLGVPLMINNKVTGAIVIHSYESQTAYEKEDLELLNSVSQHIALAIERKESDAKFAEQNKIIKKILDSSPVGIALVQNRVFKWLNNEAVKVLGYKSKQELEEKSVRIIYCDNQDYEQAGKTIFESLSAEGTADYEIDLVKKNGTRFPAHIRLNSVEKNNLMDFTIATFTDVSQRKAGEQEKFEKERLQGVLEMAGAVCHEVNQPLQAILGYSELLLLDSKLEDVDEGNISSIKNQACRLGKITQKLAGITRYRTLDYPGNSKIVDIWGASDTK